MATKPSEAISTDEDQLDFDEESPEQFSTLLGFKMFCEPMPDNPQELLYTLMHPDLPGLVYGDSDPWKLLLSGIEAAGRIFKRRMESGEPIPQIDHQKPRPAASKTRRPKRLRKAS